MGNVQADALVRDLEKLIEAACFGIEKRSDEELEVLEHYWSGVSSRYHDENRHDAGDAGWEVMETYRKERRRRYAGE